MRFCHYCSKPANTSLNIRDEWERVHTITACDEHAERICSTILVVGAQGINGGMSQKEWMAWKYGK